MTEPFDCYVLAIQTFPLSAAFVHFSERELSGLARALLHPLHFAAGYNRVLAVKYLLENGADVHARDKG